MHQLIQQVIDILPAFAFLLAAAPFAYLLDKIGFFKSVASLIMRYEPTIFTLWLFAAVVTIVLNLDTTILILTPLYIEIARRAKLDPWRIVIMPLLLACFASLPLPISNLTNLIVANGLHISSFSFIKYMTLPTIAAILGGWFMYRKVYGSGRLKHVDFDNEHERLYFRTSCVIVCLAIIGFVIGPAVHIEPWMVAALADITLVLILRTFEWKSVPLKMTLILLSVCVVILAILHMWSFHSKFPFSPSIPELFAITLSGTASANVINNLPSSVLILHFDHNMWVVWAWLIGINVGAVLLPFGAVANLLWAGIIRRNGIIYNPIQYIRMSIPIGFSALFCAIALLALESATRLR